jgi:hypothetical protein
MVTEQGVRRCYFFFAVMAPVAWQKTDLFFFFETATIISANRVDGQSSIEA